MRKQRGNFRWKFVAVLLLAAICVSFVAGAGPMEVWAEDDTQTVRLILTTSDIESIDADMVTNIALLDIESGEVRRLSMDKYDDRWVYEALGLQRNREYRWSVCGYYFKSFSSDLAVVESEVVLHRVKYWDEDNFIQQEYVPDGCGVYFYHLPIQKEGYIFKGWVPREYKEMEIADPYTAIFSPTDMKALWRRDFTQEDFKTKVSDILNTLHSTISDTTTKEMFANAIKQEMDIFFLLVLK